MSIWGTLTPCWPCGSGSSPSPAPATGSAFQEDIRRLTVEGTVSHRFSQ